MYIHLFHAQLEIRAFLALKMGFLTFELVTNLMREIASQTSSRYSYLIYSKLIEIRNDNKSFAKLNLNISLFLEP